MMTKVTQTAIGGLFATMQDDIDTLQNVFTRWLNDSPLQAPGADSFQQVLEDADILRSFGRLANRVAIMCTSSARFLEAATDARNMARS